MKKGNKKIIIWGVVIIVLAVSINAIIKNANAPGDLDEFALCLTEKEVKMYGTDWCHFCQDQKSKFGKSFKKVDYVNCDFQSELCLIAGVESYPTWQIDGETYTGVQQLNRLASLSGCVL